MLRVLLSEESPVCVREQEELQDDGRHAAKVSGTLRTAEFFCERARDLDIGHIACGVHRLGGGVKDGVDARSFELFRIGFKGARVGGEVLVRAELHGVDKDGNDDAVGTLSRRFDE